jgi:hypothetical protein
MPAQCICVFRVDLRTNSDYFPIQHWLVGFHNRDGVCLLRGTGWMFKYNLGSTWSVNFSTSLQFPLSVSLPRCPTLIFIYTLLWLGKQRGEVWEATKNRSVLSEIRETLDRKNFLVALLCHGSGGYSPSCIAEPGHVRFLVLGQMFLQILRLSLVTIRKSGSSRWKELLKFPVPYDHAIYRQFRVTN